MRFPLLILLLAVAACSYVEATTVPYAGVPKFAPVDPDTVQVLPSEPPQRHDRLGEVVLYISPDPPAPREDIEERLRKEAAKWGANAVYIVRDVLPPGKERQLVGIAIRFRQ
jgi:hypothetical protein